MDNRIEACRGLVEAMTRGDFTASLPFAGDDDATGALATALLTLQDAVQRQTFELKRLARVTEQVNAGMLLDDVLTLVYESFRDVLPYDRIGLALLDDTKTHARTRWCRSEAPELVLAHPYSAPLAGSSLQDILDTGQPRILNDLEAYLESHPNSESTRRIVQEGMRSSLTCPLITPDGPVGFLFFSSMMPETYQTAHVSTYRHVAGQLAMIIGKSRLYEQLIELTAIKSRFLGMATNDLRKPLGVIQTYTDMLLGDAKGPISAPQRHALERTREATDQLLGHLGDLLELHAQDARELTLHRQETPLTDFLVDCGIRNAALASTKSVDLEVDLPDNLPALWIDRGKMMQVADNLLSNAVAVSVVAARVTVSACVEDDRAIIRFTDRGPGIPPDEQVRIFTAGGQDQDGEPRRGLGLAITRRIVEAHGGSIHVESQLGKGASFVIDLPLAPPDGADETI